MSQRFPIYRTSKGVEVYVSKGKKSRCDFKVQYRAPGKAVRTPKHIHLIIDMYMKKCGDRDLTLKLADHMLNNVVTKVKPTTSYPPSLQIFQPQHVWQFQALDQYGEYSVEFILIVGELIAIQEKTNYPHGVANERMWRAFLEEKDIFTVVSAATFRGGK